MDNEKPYAGWFNEYGKLLEEENMLAKSWLLRRTCFHMVKNNLAGQGLALKLAAVQVFMSQWDFPSEPSLPADSWTEQNDYKIND